MAVTERASSKTDIAAALRDDGYAFVSNVLDGAACDALNVAIETCRAMPGPTFRTLSPEGTPLVQSELFRWPDNAAIYDLTHKGVLPRLAAQAFGTKDVILMEDQWFYSARGAETISPWHQDHPYHPLEPWFLTIWIALDTPPGPVGLKVAAGSHSEVMYGPVEFSAGNATLAGQKQVLQPVPDIEADPDTWRVITPPAKRGDAILMDSRTLHAAGGQCADTFRRISIRYAHPDTVFSPRNWPVAQFWDHHPIATSRGASLISDAFPLITSNT